MTGNPNAGPPSLVPKVICLSYVLKTNEFTFVLLPNRSLYRYSKIPDTWNTSIPTLFGGIPLNIHLSKTNRKSLLIFIGNLDIYSKHFPGFLSFLTIPVGRYYYYSSTHFISLKRKTEVQRKNILVSEDHRKDLNSTLRISPEPEVSPL